MAKTQANFPGSLDTLIVERKAPNPVAGDDVDIIETAITEIEKVIPRKIKIDATAAPTVDNDTTEGYAVNSLWIDITNDKAYICVDASDGAAVWIEITSQGITDHNSLGGLNDGTDYEHITQTQKSALHTQNTDTDLDATFEATFAKKADKLSAFAATTSAELAGVISDEKGAGALVFETLLAKLLPNIYNRDIKWLLKEPYTTAANRYTIQTPNRLSIDIDGTIYFIETQSDIDLSIEANWDTITTDYRVAATRAGKDFYIYACQPASGDAPVVKLSANSTVPTGYTADNSRKIGGFHCVCVAVGTIASHTLTTFVAGDVLPASIWDLEHRPICSPEGMVFDAKSQIWVDIYLASGTGASTVSVNGGTISDTRNWMDFVDDGGAVGKRMLTDIEFQLIATGSNEETNIVDNADPGTTTGHSDTASRRMISNIGCEDCCGALNQWLNEQSYRNDGVDLAAAQAWAWEDLPGAKGSLYKQGTNGDVKLIAGGNWTNGADCGSRCRAASVCRWDTAAYIGCRFGAEPRKAE